MLTSLNINYADAATPRLLVALSSTATSNTVFSHADTNILTFDITNTGRNDAEITELKLNFNLDEDLDGDYNDSSIGTDNLIHMNDVATALWIAENDGSLISSPTVTPSTGLATFGGFSYTVDAGATATIQVYANISSTAPCNSTEDHISANITDAATSITAIDVVTGKPIPARGTMINGRTDSPTVYTRIIYSGNLYIEEDMMVTPEDAIATQNSKAPLGKFRFYATEEDFEINDMSFSIIDSSGDVEYLEIVYPTNSDYPDILDGRELCISTPTSTINCKGLDIAVPEDGSTRIDVYATFSTHNQDGGTLYSDHDLSLTLEMDAYDAEFNALGQDSGHDLTETSFADVTASNIVYVYRSMPTIEVLTPSSSTLSIGDDQEVYRFNLSASTKGAIALGQAAFDVSLSGLEMDVYTPWYVVCESSGNTVATGGYNPATGIATLNFVMTPNPNGLQLTTGLTETLIVYTNIVEDSDPTTTSSMTIKLREDTSHMDTNYYSKLLTLAPTAGLIWSDIGAPSSSHGVPAPEWMVGYKVPGIPTDYVTLN